MSRLLKISVWLIAVPFCLLTTYAHGADAACEHFKSAAPLLDVVKDPAKVGNYIAELKRDDVVCIKQKKKIGRRTWGLVSHKVLKDGKKVPVAGWVGMRFMSPHKLTKPTPKARANPKPKPKPKPKTTARPASQPNLDRQAEIAYWNTVRESNSADLVMSYLEKYPNGEFAQLATLLLDKMEGDDKRKPPRTVRKDDPDLKTRSLKRKPKVKKRDVKQVRRTRSKKDRAKRRRDKLKKRQAQRPRRKRKKKCRNETKFECMARGGQVDDMGDCNVKWICK